MQTGFYTRVLDDLSLEAVAQWAAAVGFDALEMDVARHIGSPSTIAAGAETARRCGLNISAWTYFGFLLDSDISAMEQAREGVSSLVDAVAASGGGLVVTFTGRDQRRSEDENYDDLAAFLSALAVRAEQGKVRIALENWPGPHKDFVATTPAGWSRLFSMVSSPSIGLNFDPSHLVWQGIDHERALKAVAERIFLAHAKDTYISVDSLQQVGYFGSGWWKYKLPGHGVINWKRWLALLAEIDFDGMVSIEHEDAEWGFGGGGSADRRKEGLLEALRVLQDASQSA